MKSKYINNRWVRSFFVYLGLALTASTYSNWQPFFLVLKSTGAYEWVCDSITPNHDIDYATCDLQYQKLTQIFNVAGSVALAMGFVAGFMVDAIGSRFVMIMSILCVFIGYIFLNVSDESVQLYWPGLILIGLAENLAGYPAFRISQFWPNTKDTCASINISCQLLSNFVPVIMWSIISDSYKDADVVAHSCYTYYLIIIAIPCALMVLSVPDYKRLEKDDNQIIKPSPLDLVSDDSSESSSLSDDSAKARAHPVSSWRFVLFQLMLSKMYILFAIWYMILVLSIGVFDQTIMRIGGKDVGQFLGVINPFTALIGPCIGVLCDKVGAWYMFIICNIFMASAFGCAILPSHCAPYVVGSTSHALFMNKSVRLQCFI
eukprot:GHVH01000795.1.p1 GENE.GHVH01000795.1~~GHVH01000795.1.p1  ORF type:complete len:375 (+),score=30.96 GHVH01000795.1:84-1208(+)